MRVNILLLMIIMIAGFANAATHTVNQSGGADFTSVAAAMDAAGSGDIIQILDSAIYDEDFPITTQTLTIESVAGQTPTLLRSALGNMPQTLRFQSENGNTMTVRGADAASKLIIKSTLVSAAPVINTGATADQSHSIVLENAVVEVDASIDRPMIVLNNQGTHSFTNVDFVGRTQGSVNYGLVLQSAGGASFTNCNFDFAVGSGNDPGGVAGSVILFDADPINLTSGNYTFTNCGVEANAAANNNANGMLINAAFNGNVSFDDCSFSAAGGGGSIMLCTSNLSPAIAFNRPIFAGGGGAIAFNVPIGINGATISVTGEPGNKVDFDPLIAGGSVLFFRVGGGTFNFTDVEASNSGFGVFMDSWGTWAGAQLFAPLNVNLERCVITANGGNFLLWENDGANNIPNPGSSFPVNFSMNNSIINITDANAFGVVAVGLDNRSVPDSITINHSTIGGTYPNAIMPFTHPEDVLVANYSIIDDQVSAINGVTALTGQGNIIPNGTFFAGLPGDTITGVDPLLDANLLLTETSVAINAATTSTETVDYEGQARPYNGGRDIGADELFIAGLLTVSKDAADNADYDNVSAAIAAAGIGDTIRILDSSLYDEDFPIITESLTIEAAAGETPTLERSAGGNAAQTIRFQANTGSTLTLRGASQSSKITVKSSYDLGSGVVAPVINTGATFNEAQSLVLENVIVEIDSTLDGVMVNLNNAGDHTLTNVDFVGRKADATQTVINCQSLGTTTLTNCDFSAVGIGTTDYGVVGTQTTGYLITLQDRPGPTFTPAGSGSFVFADCIITASSSADNPAGCIAVAAAYDGAATFNECDLTVGSFTDDAGAILASLTTASPEITFNSPVFTGSGGNIAFQILEGASNGPTMTIAGTPEMKVDLDPLVAGGTVLYFRAGGGTYNLTDVQATTSGFGDFFDSHGLNTTDSKYFAPLNVNLDRCILSDAAGGFWLWEQSAGGVVPDPGSAFAVTVEMTNTIYNITDNSGFGVMSMSIDNRTANDSVTFTHCTIGGTYVNAIMSFIDATDTIVGNYSIFDDSNGAPFNGLTPLTGEGNYVPNATFFAGVPSDTYTNLDLQLDANLRPLASSPVIDAATTSTMTIDVDGDVRPNKVAADAGADEVQGLNSAIHWQLF